MMQIKLTCALPGAGRGKQWIKEQFSEDRFFLTVKYACKNHV